MTFVKVTAIPLSRMRFKNPHLKGYTYLNRGGASFLQVSTVGKVQRWYQSVKPRSEWETFSYTHKQTQPSFTSPTKNVYFW